MKYNNQIQFDKSNLYHNITKIEALEVKFL